MNSKRLQHKNEETPRAATHGVSEKFTTIGNLTMKNITHLNEKSSSHSCLPVIAGVEITTDEQGRFNLNALHKASSLGKSKQPSNWLRLDSTKALIGEFSNSSDMRNSVEVQLGSSGGTFAHELLAISYAGWVSPKFQLMVNQVFIDFKKGSIAPVQSIDFSNTKQVAGLLAQSLEQVQIQEKKIEELKPKAEFCDRVTALEGSISIGQAAKILGTGSKRLFQFLRENGWVTRHNEPYQSKINSGLMDVKIGHWDHPSFGIKQTVTALITGKGLVKLQSIYKVAA